MACHVHPRSDKATVQAFIKQQVAGAHRLPVGEGAGLAAQFTRFAGVMDVAPHLAAAGAGVGGKGGVQFRQQVALGPEVADLRAFAVVGRTHLGAHLGAVVAVEGIALDHLGADVLAPEDVGEAASSPWWCLNRTTR